MCLLDCFLTPEALLRALKYINIMNEAPCHCGTQAVTDFGHLGPLCKECFIDVLVKRCRKALKDAGWLKSGQKIRLLIDATAQGKAVDVLFKQVVKGLPLEYVADKEEVLIVGKTADDEVEEFLHQLFDGKLAPAPKHVNLFAHVSTPEIEKYCELEGIVGTRQPQSELRQRLNALEQRYRGTLFSLQKSQESFRKPSE